MSWRLLCCWWATCCRISTSHRRDPHPDSERKPAPRAIRAGVRRNAHCVSLHRQKRGRTVCSRQRKWADQRSGHAPDLVVDSPQIAAKRTRNSLLSNCVWREEEAVILSRFSTLLVPILCVLALLVTAVPAFSQEGTTSSFKATAVRYSFEPRRARDIDLSVRLNFDETHTFVAARVGMSQ